jgi:septal ring-binding cell division protein DamX
MAASSWKSLAMPGAILLIALGLQAGAIKIMTGASTAHEPAAADAHTASAPDHAEPPPPAPAHQTTPPAPPAHGAPSPEAGLAPTHTPAPPVTPVAAHGAPSPEAGLAPTHTPDPPVTPVAAHGAPSPEAALYNPMASNIPPPIQLDEPEPAAEQPAIDAPPPSAEAELAMATPAAEPATSPTTGELLEPDWLKGRDPKRYTVQLYSGKEMNKLQEIAKSVTGTSPAAYFTTASRSGPWYSLVVGDYADFPTAQAAATQIAGQSSTLKPWIRRFSEIQARMR